MKDRWGPLCLCKPPPRARWGFRQGVLPRLPRRGPLARPDRDPRKARLAGGSCSVFKIGDRFLGTAGHW